MTEYDGISVLHRIFIDLNLQENVHVIIARIR